MCQSGGKGQFQGYVFLVGDKKAEVVEREKLYIGTAACGAAAADSAATAGDCVVTAACSEAAAESAALAIDSWSQQFTQQAITDLAIGVSM